MARCPNCGADVPAGSRYCPECGAAQDRRNVPPEQRPLPFSPFGPPPMAPQPAGGGSAEAAEPITGPPLSTRQVAVAVGAVLLFLAFIVFFVGGNRLSRRESTPAGTPAAGGHYPVVGVVGEPVNMGKTALGVAFKRTSTRFNNQTPQKGQFYAVGVVVANRGDHAITLNDGSMSLYDEKGEQRYEPVFTAWGTPEDLNAGRYRREFPLAPRDIIAGVVVFDVPTNLGQPCLLVRDLTKSEGKYTGAIDLTKEKQE